MMDIPISDIRQILIGRRDALSEAIGALDRAMGLPVPATAAPIVTPFFAEPAPRAVSNQAKSAKTPRRATADGDIGEAILSALRKNSPQSPSELSAALSLSPSRLRHYCEPLVHNGAITVKGTTAARRISLASGKPAKEAP